MTLGIDDIDRAARFYRDGPGFPVHDVTPDVAFFRLDGSWLGLYGRRALAEDATVAADGNGFNSFSLAHNVHSEKEVDEVFQQAIDAGTTVVKPPQTVFRGGYSGYFSDPDGHLWEVAYNPFFWIGPED